MAIKVLRAAGKAKDVAAGWRHQYLRSTGWADVISGSSEKVYDAIVAADGDPDKIDVAIGNDSWTKIYCHSCGEKCSLGIEMLDPDYETTPTFCADCIAKAHEALLAAKAEGRALSHTPAPWTHTKGGRVVGPEGNTIADCRYRNGASDGPLIAAAPHLLEALKVAMITLEENDFPLAAKAIAGVIAKATGGPHV